MMGDHQGSMHFVFFSVWLRLAEILGKFINFFSRAGDLEKLNCIHLYKWFMRVLRGMVM